MGVGGETRGAVGVVSGVRVSKSLPLRWANTNTEF